MIPDTEIPGADPAAVIEQYKPYVIKLSSRYKSVLDRSGAVDRDDLYQAGYMAIMDAQRRYNPEQGQFLNLLFYVVRKYMRNAVGIDNITGAAPEQLVYLDAPVSSEDETALGDTIPDPDAVPLDEPMLEDEQKSEISEQIHAALDRMKSEKQREVIQRVYLDGQTRAAAAEGMEIKTTALYALDREGRRSLRRDEQLKRFVRDEVPFFHVGSMQFNSTWTSATEKAVLWRDRYIYKNYYPGTLEAP